MLRAFWRLPYRLRVDWYRRRTGLRYRYHGHRHRCLSRHLFFVLIIYSTKHRFESLLHFYLLRFVLRSSRERLVRTLWQDLAKVRSLLHSLLFEFLLELPHIILCPTLGHGLSASLVSVHSQSLLSQLFLLLSFKLRLLLSLSLFNAVRSVPEILLLNDCV